MMRKPVEIVADRLMQFAIEVEERIRTKYRGEFGFGKVSEEDFCRELWAALFFCISWTLQNTYDVAKWEQAVFKECISKYCRSLSVLGFSPEQLDDEISFLQDRGTEYGMAVNQTSIENPLINLSAAIMSHITDDNPGAFSMEGLTLTNQFAAFMTGVKDLLRNTTQ